MSRIIMSGWLLARRRGLSSLEYAKVQVFVWHDFSHFDFSGQNLTGTRFVYCDIREADFTDAVITGAELRYLDYPPTVEQIQSTWNFKHGRTSGIALPKELRAALHLE